MIELTQELIINYITSNEVSFADMVLLAAVMSLLDTVSNVQKVLEIHQFDPEDDKLPGFVKVILGAEVIDDIVIREAREAFILDVKACVAEQEAQDGR